MADWSDIGEGIVPTRQGVCHTYSRIAYDDRAGQAFSASIPPMTAQQLVRHLRERLQCPHVAVTMRKGRFIMLAARWPDLTRRGIVAVGEKKR
jgi:hypothetical protein